MTTIDLTLEIIQQLRGLADSFELMLKVADKQNEANGKSRPDHKKSDETLSTGVSENADKTESEADGNSETANINSNTQEPEKQPTLEEVREYMAEKIREGHREAIKAILARYSADKLTNLDPNHYSKVLKEAGELK